MSTTSLVPRWHTAKGVVLDMDKMDSKHLMNILLRSTVEHSFRKKAGRVRLGYALRQVKYLQSLIEEYDVKLMLKRFEDQSHDAVAKGQANPFDWDMEASSPEGDTSLQSAMELALPAFI